MQIKVVSRARPPGLLQMSPEQRALVLEELELYLRYPLARSLRRAVEHAASILIRQENPGIGGIHLRRLLGFAVLQPVIASGASSASSAPDLSFEIRVPTMEVAYATAGPQSTMVSNGTLVRVVALQVRPERLGAEFLVAPFPTSGILLLGADPAGEDFTMNAPEKTTPEKTTPEKTTPVDFVWRFFEVPAHLRIRRFAHALAPRREPLTDLSKVQAWLRRLDYLAQLLPWDQHRRQLPQLKLPETSSLTQQWGAITTDAADAADTADAADDTDGTDGIVALSSRLAREVEERARSRLLESERAVWARLLQARAARQWGYDIGRRLGLPLKGLRPGDDLSALPDKVRKIILARMELETRQAQAVANNKCPHLRLIPQFRRARTLADADRAFQRLAKLFAKNSVIGFKARTQIRCALCDFDLLCPHVVELHQTQMRQLRAGGASSAELERRMRPFTASEPLPHHDADELPEVSISLLRNTCRICVEPITALEELGLDHRAPADDGRRMQELAASLAEDLGFQDVVLGALRSQLAIARLVLRSADTPLEVVLVPAERAARPFVAAIDDAIGRKRLLHREARLRVFAGIYLWAAILAMSKRRPLGINDKALTPDSAAAFLRRLLRRQLDEIAPADTGFLRRTLDAATQRVALAVQALERRGIRLASSGPSETMYLDWLLASGVYVWLDTMSPRMVPTKDNTKTSKSNKTSKSASKLPKPTKRDKAIARLHALLKDGPEAVLKHGAPSPFIAADIPPTPPRAKSAFDAVAASEPQMEWISPDGSAELIPIDGLAWDGLIWESFQQTMALARAPDRSVYTQLLPTIERTIQQEQTLARAQRAWFRQPLASVCRVSKYDVICPTIARTHTNLARLYDENGRARVWDRLYYRGPNGTLETSLKELQAAYADPAAHKELLTRYSKPGWVLVDRQSGDLRWSAVNAWDGERLRRSNATIRAARELLSAVEDTLRAFAALCPAGTAAVPGHVFKKDVCERCGFSFALSPKEELAYHQRWNSAADRTEAELGRSEADTPLDSSDKPEKPEKLTPATERLLRQIATGATSAASLAKLAIRFKLPAWAVTYMGATTGVLCEEISQGKVPPPQFDFARLLAVFGRIDTVSRDIVRLSHGIIPSGGEFDPYRKFRDLVGQDVPLREMRALAKPLLALRDSAKHVLALAPAADVHMATLALLGLLGDQLGLLHDSSAVGAKLARWYLEQFAHTDLLFCKTPPGTLKLNTKATRDLAKDVADLSEGPGGPMDADGAPSHELAQEDRARARGTADVFSLENQDFDGFEENDDYEID